MQYKPSYICVSQLPLYLIYMYRATLSGRSGQPELWAASDDSDAYLTGEGALLIEDDEELAGIKLTTTGTGATTSIASGKKHCVLPTLGRIYLLVIDRVHFVTHCRPSLYSSSC